MLVSLAIERIPIQLHVDRLNQRRHVALDSLNHVVEVGREVNPDFLVLQLGHHLLWELVDSAIVSLDLDLDYLLLVESLVDLLVGSLSFLDGILRIHGERNLDRSSRLLHLTPSVIDLLLGLVGIDNNLDLDRPHPVFDLLDLTLQLGAEPIKVGHDTDKKPSDLCTSHSITVLVYPVACRIDQPR